MVVTGGGWNPGTGAERGGPPWSSPGEDGTQGPELREEDLRGRDRGRMEPRDRSRERGTSVVVTGGGWNPGTGAERGGPPWS